MALTQINNGDTGLVARNKINTAFSTVDNLPLPSSASVQTSNGATTSIVTLTMGTYSAYSVESTISAWDNSNLLGYGSQLFAVFTNNGLAVSQVGTTDVYEKTGFSTATSHIYVNGGNVVIYVIGEASKTINWTVNYSVTKI
jgi:hypothetical protein